MKTLSLTICCLGPMSCLPALGGDPLAALDEALNFSACDDKLRVTLSGYYDLEYYHFDRPAPGLLYTDGSDLLNQRLTLFLDAQIGSRIYAFAQGRLDQGFDPSDGDVELRLDEWAIRYSPDEEGRFSLQAGTFNTAVGTWAQRSYSWDNPFVNAPVPYENLTGIWDSELPDSGKELRGWGHVVPTPWLPNETADKHLRNPIAWGPSYGTGIAVMGRIGEVDYNLEIKNTSLSSRPGSWGVGDTDFSNPTFSGRIGWRPSPMWRFGASASVGAYLLPEAGKLLPAGKDLGDYRQIVFAQDAGFEWHHWQVWAEVFETRFETPFGDADTVAYYIETKYQFAPRFFGAVRFNQQLYGDVPLAAGGDAPWGADLWRVDTALGWRPTEYTQLKLQYSLQREQAAMHDLGHLVATQFTLRF
jgi:hypothetical protein